MNLHLATRGIADLLAGATFLAAALTAQATDVVPAGDFDNMVTIVLALIGGGGILGWAIRAVLTTVLRRGDEDRAADRALLERIMDENAELSRQQRDVYSSQLTMLRDLLAERRPPDAP
jgi:hypothetical protein